MVESIGKLAGVGIYLADYIERKMGGWESIEMVQRYAHLAPEHLSQHARLIDSGCPRNRRFSPKFCQSPKRENLY